MHHCFTLFPSSSFSSLPTSHPDWSLTPEQVEVTTAIVDIDHSSTVTIRFVGSTHCKVYTTREGGDEKGGEEERGEGESVRSKGGREREVGRERGKGGEEYRYAERSKGGTHGSQEVGFFQVSAFQYSAGMTLHAYLTRASVG